MFANVEALYVKPMFSLRTKLCSPLLMQFGMLIEFLFEKFPNWEELGSQAIGDLQVRCFHALLVLLYSLCP
jgi:hypothetical protein